MKNYAYLLAAITCVFVLIAQLRNCQQERIKERTEAAMVEQEAKEEEQTRREKEIQEVARAAKRREEVISSKIAEYVAKRNRIDYLQGRLDRDAQRIFSRIGRDSIGVIGAEIGRLRQECDILEQELDNMEVSMSDARYGGRRSMRFWFCAILPKKEFHPNA